MALIITGERAGISNDDNQAMRNSGLFHILSISGLHMVIMAGTMFWLERAALALFPSIALRYPIRKWAEHRRGQGQDRKPSSAIQRRSKRTAASPISSLLRSASAWPVARRAWWSTGTSSRRRARMPCTSRGYRSGARASRRRADGVLGYLSSSRLPSRQRRQAKSMREIGECLTMVVMKAMTIAASTAIRMSDA